MFRQNRRMQQVGRYILYALPLIFLAIFFFYPLAGILRVSFVPKGQLKLDGVAEMLAAPFFRQVLWFTTWQAVASTALSLALALPLAYVFAKFVFPGKQLALALMTIPFVMPTVVVAAAFSALLGPSGTLNRWLQSWFQLEQPPIQLLGTVWIILIVHAFYNVSIIVRTVSGFWSNLNPSLGEAGAVLGASRGQLLRAITLPLLAPSILASTLLVFLFTFTSFGVVLILGGLRFATIEVEIYRQAVSLFNLPVAAALSLVQIGITFAVMAVYTRIQARSSHALNLRPRHATVRRPASAGEWLLVGGSLIAILLMLLSPLLALAWRSFTLGDQGLSLQYYFELGVDRRQSAFFVTPITAVRNSLLFALATMLLSLLLGVISAYLLAKPRGRATALLDPIFLLPLGASAITLGFGYIVTMGSLRTTLLLTPIAHTLIAAPFVVRMLLPALRSLDPKLRESAAMMGASTTRIWWEIDVPMLFRAVLVGAAFAFTISMGEFGATLLVSRPDYPTMPVVIYRALGQPGLLNYGQALAMSTLLMVISAVGLLLIERFRVNQVGEF